MKITNFLKKNDKDNTPVSFELLPPMKGRGIQSIYKSLDRLMEFNPPFINVTYHRSEYIYKKMPGGFFKKVITQ
jgi:methylenetetrahydrofolate reductase (NADPH)